MTELAKDSTTLEVETLLHNYGFDLGGYTAQDLINHWAHHHPIPWLKSAVVEALYQGRYKAVSVDQILTLWHRRGQPCQHFNHEFERIICSRLPRDLTVQFDPTPTQAMWTDLVSATAVPSTTTHAISQSTEISIEQEGAIATPSTEADLPQHQTPNLMNAPELDRSAVPDDESAQPEEIQPTLKIQTFKPASLAELQLSQEGNWSKGDVVKQPIHQFIPTAEMSEFYIKLKAVSQTRETDQTSHPTMVVIAKSQEN